MTNTIHVLGSYIDTNVYKYVVMNPTRSHEVEWFQEQPKLTKDGWTTSNGQHGWRHGYVPDCKLPYYLCCIETKNITQETLNQGSYNRNLPELTKIFYQTILYNQTKGLNKLTVGYIPVKIIYNKDGTVIVTDLKDNIYTYNSKDIGNSIMKL